MAALCDPGMRKISHFHYLVPVGKHAFQYEPGEVQHELLLHKYPERLDKKPTIHPILSLSNLPLPFPPRQQQSCPLPPASSLSSSPPSTKHPCSAFPHPPLITTLYTRLFFHYPIPQALAASLRISKGRIASTSKIRDAYRGMYASGVMRR